MQNQNTAHTAKTVALHLQAGEELYVRNLSAPRGVAILGQDFSFTPPYRGRPQPGKSVDEHRMALVSAMSPLALSVSGLWHKNGVYGCLRIHHLRPAREGMIPAIAGHARVCWQTQIILACKEQARLEDYVEDGLHNAVLYPDETLVAGYRAKAEGETGTLPFSFVIRTDEMDALRGHARRMIGERRAVKQGRPQGRHVRPCGLIMEKAVGPNGCLKVRYDQAGRVHGLALWDESKGTHTPRETCFVGRTIRLTVGEVVTNADVRAGLCLPPMAIDAPMIPAFGSIRNSVGDRIAAVQKAAAVAAESTPAVVDETPEEPHTIDEEPQTTEEEVVIPEPVVEPEPDTEEETPEEVGVPEPVVEPEPDTEEETPEEVGVPEPDVEHDPDTEEETHEAPETPSAEVINVDRMPTLPPSEKPTREQIDTLWQLLQGEVCPHEIRTQRGKVLVKKGSRFNRLHAQLLLQRASQIEVTEENQTHTGLVFECLI